MKRNGAPFLRNGCAVLAEYADWAPIIMNKKKSIKVNAVLNSLRMILNLVFPLITFPYVSRVLKVDELGKYNFSSSIVSYFMLFAALGIDKFAIREGAKYREDKEKLGEFASQVFTINLISTVVSYIALAFYLLYSNKAADYRICILVFSLQIFFTTIGVEWIYSIFEEYKYITIRSIIFKLISIILLFVFVRHQGDYLKYSVVTVFATVGSNILNYFNVHKYCNLKITFHINWRKMLVPILVIFGTNVAIQIYVNSDTTMLGYLKDDYTVGIYSFSVKIYNMIKNVLVAALTVTIPRLSLYAGQHRDEAYTNLFTRLINSLLLLSVPSMIGLICLSRNVILILGGQRYLAAQPSLIILSIAIIFSVMSTLFNTCILIPYKREKCSLKSSIVSACENIGLNFILIPFLAENGAAFTTVLAEFTMAMMNYISSKDIVKAVFINKKTICNIISIMVGCAGIIFSCLFVCTHIENIIAQTIVAILVSFVVYTVILVALKNPVVKYALVELKNRNNA